MHRPLEGDDDGSSSILDVIEESLQRGKATCVAFNRRGTLLAAGTSGGRIVIWDFDTRSVAREFVPTAPMPGGDDGTTDDDPHGVAILSVAWSRDGRKVVSAAADGAIVVWDVAESDDVFRATFDAPLHRVAFDPTNASVALVCPSHDGPMTFVLGRGRKKTYLPQMPGGVEAASLVCRIPGRGLDENAASRAPAYAIYSKSARHVFVANNRGVITVVETATMDIVQALKVPDATVVKRIELSKDGLKLLVTSNARALNSYDVAEPDASSPSKGQMSHTAGVLRASTTYLNATHRSQWAAAAYTSDGAYVVGASAGSSHELHVWETNSGALVRILQGGADTKGITQIAPHPLRSLVVAVGANGTLYMWSKSYVENWSAFDPEFHEVKENEVYVEREDEFDLIADEVRDEIENGGKRATDRAAIAPAEAEAEADPKPKEEEGVAGDKEPTLALPATAAEAAVAEDAAAAAEELRIEKIKSAAIMRHRAAAAKATKEALNAAKQAEADAANVVIDILTRESGYYTDEGEEDCLHFLPLDLTPAEDAVRIVEERKRRWRAREERKLAEEAAANAVGAVGEKRKERDEDDFREDDEDAEDAEEEAEDEDEEDEDAEVAEEEAEEEADDAGEEREDVEMIDDE